MEMKKSFPSLILFFALSLLLYSSADAAKKSYIVYLGGHPQLHEGAFDIVVEEQRKAAHYELLGTVLGSKDKAQDAIFYSYTKHVNGFAAMLEEEEAAEISKIPGVLSVIPNIAYKLHTTRSWGFLGLDGASRMHAAPLWKRARRGKNTIIATLDSGVWPESESFNDRGIGPIPSRWKGGCETGFPCNRKLIGARHFVKGFLAEGGMIDLHTNSTRDIEGHGTHTLSTAGGRFVANASFFNNARGIAKGGSPNARVAAYKVCWPGKGCYSADILAAFEAAISDGVDVISVSLGGDNVDYFLDGLTIGSFHAMKRGISVVCSAGNDGPDAGSVVNVAPWVFTVAASTIDRSIRSSLSLGNKKQISGTSLSENGLRASKPIVRAEDVRASNASRAAARLCLPGSLDPKKAGGRIVVCVRGNNTQFDKSLSVRDAGGAGMVIANDRSPADDSLRAAGYLIPAIHISRADSLSVFSYLNSTKSPYGFIAAPKTELRTQRAPLMAGFSSAGPNMFNPEILKPDITAPGVDILAAYPPIVPATDEPDDERRLPFTLLSGTSMSCPHISGIVGLLRSIYPDWSPAAVRSALMTTAVTRDNRRDPISMEYLEKATPFNYGSGHVSPNRAMDPGLVYDLNVTDYLDFLCSLGYNSSQVATLNDGAYSCPSRALDLKDFNYPSISNPRLHGSVTVRRTVKNVGAPGTYRAHVIEPEGVSVSVKPERLEFGKMGEERTFEVTLVAKKNGPSEHYVFGKLVWSDGKHFVRSPIAVHVTGG